MFGSLRLHKKLTTLYRQNHTAEVYSGILCSFSSNTPQSTEFLHLIHHLIQLSVDCGTLNDFLDTAASNNVNPACEISVTPGLNVENPWVENSIRLIESVSTFIRADLPADKSNDRFTA